MLPSLRVFCWMRPLLNVQMDGNPIRVFDALYLHLGFHVDFNFLFKVSDE
jgi:hypothetical protein